LLIQTAAFSMAFGVVSASESSIWSATATLFAIATKA